MFRLCNHHQGAYCMCFVKVMIVKQSVKIRPCGVCTVHRAEHGALYTHHKDWVDMQPHGRIHSITTYFN